MDKAVIALEKGYHVDWHGNLFNKDKEKISGSVKPTGYKVISFSHKGKKHQCLVHRLQAYQKYRNFLLKPGIVVRHKNGNPLDNSFYNVRIGTQSDNMMDIPQERRIKQARHAASFTKKYDRDKIKAFHSKDKSYKKTMKEFDISSKGTLNFILNN